MTVYKRDVEKILFPSVAVMDATSKVVMESFLETKAATILEFFAGLRRTLWVTFEEGTWSVWP